MNKVAMQLRRPAIASEKNTYTLSSAEYQWDITDAGGSPLAPESLQGEVIFLNFWGTYCPPCIAEMPEIQGLYDTYKDRVKFILVSGEAPEKVDGFMARNNYILPSYYGGRSMPEVLSVRSVPTTFIIARDGRIVSKEVGAAKWNSKATWNVLDELLK